jgi:anti-sigma factor RsiW
MSEVTKNVVLDLLPLYLAGEVSADSAALVKKYLETDPELAEMARKMAQADALNEIPVPLKKEAAMETYQEAKKWLTIKTLGLAGLIAGTLLCVLLVVPVIVLMFR